MNGSLPLHDPAWVTSIGGVLAVFTGFIVALLKSIWEHRQTREAIRQVKHEVTNDHPINLRDDMDGKHIDVVTMIENLAERVASLSRQLEEAERARKADQRTLIVMIEANTTRLDDTTNSVRSLERRVDANQQAHREAQATCRDNCISRIELLETSHPTQ